MTGYRTGRLMVEDLTKAINATHSPIPMKSIRAQWPVSTQTHTTWLRDCVNILVFSVLRVFCKMIFR